jgi:hypothetical protein
MKKPKICPCCKRPLDLVTASELGRKGGSVKSEAKTRACRENWKGSKKGETAPQTQ